MKVVIVGAGIAGLAIGWRLAQAKVQVEIFDRAIAGRGATWAAAGMIAPNAELMDEAHELARFARYSRAAWPGFAAELERESGYSIGYSEPGSLLLAPDRTHASQLKERATRLAVSGSAEWITADALRKREPLLSPQLHGALHIAGDALVDNRTLGDALCAALSKRNVPLRENTEITGLLVTQDRARGVMCGGSAIAADAIIIASGAWMSSLVESSGGLPPMKPVKGQMLSVEPPAQTALPRQLLWAEDVYLVPRHDRLLIGATVEDEGLDTSVSRETCARLVAAAARIIPKVAEWRISEMWAGLRPCTPDGAPVLGPTPTAGVFVAGGQYRNGILFAPAVAEAMSRMVLAVEAVAEFRAFDPRRFF